MLPLPRQPAAEQSYRCGVLHSVLLLFLIAATLPPAARGEMHYITAVRFWSLGDITRIAIESDGDFAVRSDRLENPGRLFFDLVCAKPNLGHKGMIVIPVSDA